MKLVCPETYTFFAGLSKEAQWFSWEKKIESVNRPDSIPYFWVSDEFPFATDTEL